MKSLESKGVLRAYTPVDIDDVMRIWLEANEGAHAFVPAGYWKEHFENVRSMLPDADILIEENGKMRGFIGLMPQGYIAGLFVLEEYRGMGVGSALLRECQRRFRCLSLDVFVRNVSAVAFYRRHGFDIEKKGVHEDTGEEEYRIVWNAPFLSE